MEKIIINKGTIAFLESENEEDICLGAKMLAKESGVKGLELMLSRLAAINDFSSPILAATRRYAIRKEILSLKNRGLFN